MDTDRMKAEEEIERHLRQALDAAETSEARYHLRQALQFVEFRTD